MSLRLPATSSRAWRDRIGPFAVWMLALTSTALPARALAAESWPQFRGPGGNALAPERSGPKHWNADKNVLWKVALPGFGWSQPVVCGGKVFVTTAVTDRQVKPQGGQAGPGLGILRGLRFGSGLTTGGPPPEGVFRWDVVCLDGRTGEVVWQRTARQGRPTIPTHRSNTYASETPVTDGERVIAYFGMTGLYCYDLEGALLWSKQLGAYPMQFGWGTGSSPVLDGESLYVQCDNEKQSFLAAFDKRTGAELWRVDRAERSNWATPYIWRSDGRTELVTAGGTKVRSYDPATGTLLWELHSGGRCAASPVGDSERVYVGSVERLTGRSGPLAAVRAGAHGDISLQGNATSNQFVVWSDPRGTPPVASPLLYRGCLYALDQQGGILRCYDAATGKLHYRKRLPGASGFTASPWATGGNVFCLDEDGRTFVVAAGPELKVVTINALDEMFWSSAAFDGDHLLLRGVDHLYRIGQPAAQ